MILQLNDVIPCNHGVDTYRECIDSVLYPEQDPDYLNKIVHVKFMDEEDGIVRSRLYINKNNFPDFTEELTYDNVAFKILRFDLDFPNITILVDRTGRIIVSKTDKIKSMKYYPGYPRRDNEIELEEVDWDTFNSQWKDDYIHLYPIQDDSRLGMAVYCEYNNDLYKLKAEDNKLNPGPQVPTPESVDSHVKEVWDGLDNDIVHRWPSEILQGYNYVHNERKYHKVNTPRRAVNMGIIIRCDVNNSSDTPGIVVMDIDKDGNRRFVTDYEGYFYYNTDDFGRTSMRELNLWQE